MSSSFPPGFTWGVASAAYQIEGAVTEDGRGASIWDTFSHTPGKTLNGDTGDVACDHYHRFEQDIDLMAQLGVSSYRFSVAWPRVLPTGSGTVNEKGLAFYDRLVDGLLARGIAPAVTLYHWDLPQPLQDRGGWPSRDTAGRFADYADVVFRRLGDRVARWITHNEPGVAAFLGHFTGEHAPGVTDFRTALAAAHHLCLSHGWAAAAHRAAGLRGELGVTLNLTPIYPASDTDEDAVAARSADGYWNRWFLDPFLRGRYPEDMVNVFAPLSGPLDFVREGDLAAIGAPVEFLGVNYYTREVVRADPAGRFGFTALLARTRGVPVTEMGWEIFPHGLLALLVRLKGDYGDLPLYITEGGAAFDDALSPDGEVRDAPRVEYLSTHFQAALDAIAQGVDLRGYYVWSLLDNFEWAYGYSKRFGILYVDFPTQRRIAKASARLVQQVIRENAIPSQPEG